jgi:predicted nucleic acid-binding protein
MILVDASVIFDHTRNRDPRLASLFSTIPVAVCGVTRTEVLHGARNPSDRATLVALLNRFGQIPTPEATWDLAGDNLCTLRMNGLTIPLADVLLAGVAIVHDIELWTRDAHFTMIQQHLPALKLFQEPL